MNLPDYFLADLSSQAAVTAAMVRDACATLRRNRDQYLDGRSTSSLVKILVNLAENWLDPEYPFRRRALEEGPAATGFSPTTLARGLDVFFAQVTRDQLQALIVQDLGHSQRLDDLGFIDNESHPGQGSTALARGPDLLVHVTAGVIPTPVFTSILLGLLVRSAQFVKCASGTALLPRLFAHSLYAAEPKLAACLEIAEWPGGTRPLEEVLFAEANTVTAMGHDHTLDAIRRRLPSRVRFLGYGHRVSFGYLAKEVLSTGQARDLAEAAARDVAAWNQLGCLSPQLFYVEEGGSVSPEGFAELLASALEHRESLEPRGEVPLEVASQIAHLRSCCEIRSLNSANIRLWMSPNSTAWTVIYEADPLYQNSCLHRCIWVKAAANLTEVLHQAEAVRGKVSTVGLAAAGATAQAAARQLSRWGVTRICPIGQMQNPPLAWRHDGRPPLADLVAWSQWER